MTDLKWQDPPQDPRGRKPGHGRWKMVADELRSRPGEWALVLVGSASNVQRIKRGEDSMGPGFDATSRRRPDGKFDVYARFVGE